MMRGPSQVSKDLGGGPQLYFYHPKIFILRARCVSTLSWFCHHSGCFHGLAPSFCKTSQ